MARRVNAFPLNEVHAAALMGFVPYAARELEALGERYGRRGQEFTTALLAGIVVQADRMAGRPGTKDPSNIVIEGPPGVGKTTIIRDAVRGLKRAFASYADDYPRIRTLWPNGVHYIEIKSENLGVNTLEPIPVVDEEGNSYRLLPLKIVRDANTAFLFVVFIDDFTRGMQFSYEAKQAFFDGQVFDYRVLSPMINVAAWNTNKDTENASPVPQAILSRTLIAMRWGHVSTEEFAHHSAHMVASVATVWRRFSKKGK